MKEQSRYIRVLIELHQGLERQGPGDADYSKFIISQLPELPENLRIADIGCGSGAGTLILAEEFKSKVLAVDFSQEFLDELEIRAGQCGIKHLVETIKCDMGNLDFEKGSIDLLWSEGAAYNITFEGALKAWRPLIAFKGIAVISEMNYFSNKIPEPLNIYMQNAYPAIKTESENHDIINSSSFEILGIHRLPSEAWWSNYYDPLRKNIENIKNSDDTIVQSVILVYFCATFLVVL